MLRVYFHSNCRGNFARISWKELCILCFQRSSRVSEPARPPPPAAGASAAAAAAALGPSTTEDELNALLSQIDQVHKLIYKTREPSLFHVSPQKNQEISLDPELAEDLLDILVKKTTVCNKHQSIDKLRI